MWKTFDFHNGIEMLSLHFRGFKFDVRSAAEEWKTRRERRPRQDRNVAKFMHAPGICITSFFGTASKRMNPALPSVRFE